MITLGNFSFFIFNHMIDYTIINYKGWLKITASRRLT